MPLLNLHGLIYDKERKVISPAQTSIKTGKNEQGDGGREEGKYLKCRMLDPCIVSIASQRGPGPNPWNLRVGQDTCRMVSDGIRVAHQPL